MKRADDMFKRKRKLNLVFNLSSIDLSHEQKKINFDDMQVEKQRQVGGQNATIHFLSSDQVTSHFSLSLPLYSYLSIRSFAVRHTFNHSNNMMAVKWLLTHSFLLLSDRNLSTL